MLCARTMVRKKCTVPLWQHYSRDLKQRIIHMSQKLHLSSTEISLMLDMPLCVVQRVRRVWNEIDEVYRQRVRSGREPLMSREAIDMTEHS
jgi:hypothetical protein